MIRNDRVPRFELTNRRVASRSGLSVLEIVGCAVAIVGGAFLGALYLGIDVGQLAHTALAEADLLDSVPESWRPAAQEDNRKTREQMVEALRDELGSLRTDISTLRDGTSSSATADDAQRPTKVESASAEPGDETTLAYWTRLNEIAGGQATMQREAELAFDEKNAARVFAVKSRISHFAAKAVEAIPSEGVDSSVIQFGNQLSNWYRQAGEMNDKAVQIWESAAGSQSRALLNEEWKRTELQHRNESRLLDEKAAAVRGALGRKYGRDFPEFVRMSATEAPRR
jgi:hypothetical protein